MLLRAVEFSQKKIGRCNARPRNTREGGGEKLKREHIHSSWQIDRLAPIDNNSEGAHDSRRDDLEMALDEQLAI